MKDKYKMVVIICISIFLYQSCSVNFNEKFARKKVELSNDDLGIFKKFNSMIIDDLQDIRDLMKPAHASGAKQIGTNSYYLYQIDKKKYSQIINKLQRRKIFTDNIEIGPNGMIAFRLKDMTNMKYNDYNDSYTHELVFAYDSAEYGYSNMTIELDSIIDSNIRYIFFTAKTGH